MDIDVTPLIATGQTFPIFRGRNMTANEQLVSATLTGLDAAGAIAVIANVAGMAGEVDVAIQTRATDEDEWTTLDTIEFDASGLNAAIVAPGVQTRVTVTTADDDVSACTHFEISGRPMPAYLTQDKTAFVGVAKPTVDTADAAHLLAALVTLGLVVDGT